MKVRKAIEFLGNMNENADIKLHNSLGESMLFIIARQ